VRPPALPALLASSPAVRCGRPETHPYPDESSPLLSNLSDLLETAGIHNPLTKVPASPLGCCRGGR
jgi:hypothetical protein